MQSSHTFHTVKEFYSGKLNLYQANIKRLDTLIRFIGFGRLVTLLIAVYGFYELVKNASSLSLVTAILMTSVFIILIIINKRKSQEKNQLLSLCILARQEIDFLEKGVKQWPDGIKYLESRHPYAEDLDLFGPESFFHFLNRTVTPGGEKLLAGRLLHPEKQPIRLNQEAIKELYTMPEWRLDFLASGLGLKQDHPVENILRNWQEMEVMKGSRRLLLQITSWVLPVLTIGSLLFFWTGIIANVHIPLYFYLGNLVVLIVFSPDLKKYHKPLAGLSRSLNSYSRMLRKMGQHKFSGEALMQLQDILKNKATDVSKALYSLTRLLEQFDSMGNVLAISIIDGLFLYHLHGLQKLLKWKEKYESEIESWLKVIYEVDMLCSLSNFAFNNPSAIFPEISEKPLLVLENSGHPLLPAEKRVDNSISFSEKRMFILTGSNMAGKSTFLRTVGISLLMAELGMPVIASKMICYPFDLLMSMRVGDSLNEGESLFYAELKRLHSIIDHIRDGNESLVLLDEILRGTNSDDKYKGTTGFLSQLVKANTFGILATNDLKVSAFKDTFPDQLENICFEVEVLDTGLRFDYKLKPGICSKLSASFLMQQMGIISN